MGKNKAGCFFIVEQEVSNQQNRHGCKPVPGMWHETGRDVPRSKGTTHHKRGTPFMELCRPSRTPRRPSHVCRGSHPCLR